MIGEAVEFVEVQGARLWTVTSGHGVPLVLCHGGPGLSDNFAPVAAEIDDLARVHRYDQRGSGRSSAAGALDVASFVADLDALREHWGHERWVVGGHSWGALLSLAYAVEHPDRTLGLVLIATPSLWPDELERSPANVLTDAELVELSGLRERAAFGNKAVQDRMLRLLWTTDFADRACADRVLDAGPLYELPRNEEVVRAVRASFSAAVEGGFEAKLQELSMPSLFIQGDHDRPDAARQDAALLEGSEFVEITRAGHTPWLEQPTAVRELLRAFLHSVASNGNPRRERSSGLRPADRCFRENHR